MTLKKDSAARKLKAVKIEIKSSMSQEQAEAHVREICTATGVPEEIIDDVVEQTLEQFSETLTSEYAEDEIATLTDAATEIFTKHLDKAIKTSIELFKVAAQDAPTSTAHDQAIFSSSAAKCAFSLAMALVESIGNDDFERTVRVHNAAKLLGCSPESAEALIDSKAEAKA